MEQMEGNLKNQIKGHQRRSHGIRGTIRTVFASLLPLSMAGGLFWFLFGRDLLVHKPPLEPPINIEAQLAEICVDEPSLASRLASQWAYIALGIGTEDGIAGLRTLDTFGDDAAYLFEKDRTAFGDLKSIMELEGPLYTASTGPWKKAVVEWAMAGKLRAYREYMERLGPTELEELRRNPACLPLLGQNAPIAKKMLTKYGSRAWHLFMLADFGSGGTESVERLAECLDRCREEILDLNERYGLAVALMLVPPNDDADERMPNLFHHAMERLGIEEAAALFLTQYDDLYALSIKEKRSPADLDEVVDLLAELQPKLRAFVADSGYSLRHRSNCNSRRTSDI